MMKEIQSNLLQFLENENDEEENYQNVMKIISNTKLFYDYHQFKSFLYLISRIANNHYRCPNFISKIEKILLAIKDHIKRKFTNKEIFYIFKDCKLLILFLHEENIMNINESIINEMKSMKEQDYQLFFTEKNSENSIQKKKLGENDDQICQIIRDDKIEEFIILMNKNDHSVNLIINQSIYETNSFLIKNEATLIEYAAFFGSIQIFKYLYKNGAKINHSIWIYAIHGYNPELISFLEENKITPFNDSYEECFNESIKCHHNDMANYIMVNFLGEKSEPKNYDQNQISAILKYYNYLYLSTKESNNDLIFDFACKYDHFLIVENYLKYKNFNNKAYGLIKQIRYASEKCNNEILYLLFMNTNVLCDFVFSDFTKLKKLTIPSTINIIESKAFYKCYSLEEIEIPSSVTYIGSSAFEGCSSLKEIIIPPFVDSIGNQIFKNCTSLQKIKLSNLIKYIGEYSFQGCSSLTNIIIPNSIIRIGKLAFYECTSLKEITIPCSVTNMEDYVFERCSSLQKVTISSSLTYISAYLFHECSLLNNVIFPPSVKSINKYAFSECCSLKKIVIPSNVIDIGTGAFENCSSLEEVTIQSPLSFIRKNTFKGCKLLYKIIIPESMKSIHKDAFKGCTKLKRLKLPRSARYVDEDPPEENLMRNYAYDYGNNYNCFIYLNIRY